MKTRLSDLQLQGPKPTDKLLDSDFYHSLWLRLPWAAPSQCLGPQGQEAAPFLGDAGHQ